jgi:hypothetical protein
MHTAPSPGYPPGRVGPLLALIFAEEGGPAGGRRHQFLAWLVERERERERDGEEGVVGDVGRCWEMLSARGDEFCAMVNYCPKKSGGLPGVSYIAS